MKKKTTKQIINEYVERNDVIGLADYFKAYLEDEAISEYYDKKRKIKKLK